MMGAAPLGVYALAFRVATLVNDKIGPMVTAVSFPALSAMESERERVMEHWFVLMRTLALVCFPALSALAVCADDFVRVAYGSQWTAAVMPLRLLCAVGVLRTLTPVTLALTAAQGRMAVNVKYAAANVVLLPLGFVVGCKLDGLVGVGLAWMIVFPVSCLYLFTAAAKQVGAGLGSFAANLKYPVLLALLPVVPMMVIRTMVSPGFGRLAAAGSVGGVVFVASVWVVPEVRRRLAEGLRGLHQS
jgi:lipopolysaccharide exporter